MESTSGWSPVLAPDRHQGDQDDQWGVWNHHKDGQDDQDGVRDHLEDDCNAPPPLVA